MIDIEKQKALFEERLATLQTRVSQIEADLRSPHDPDWEERALQTEGDEVREGLEGSALKEIDQIRSALNRIAAGTYGTCATCGAEISARRLEALPYAAQCINCADTPPD